MLRVSKTLLPSTIRPFYAEEVSFSIAHTVDNSLT